MTKSLVFGFFIFLCLTVNNAHSQTKNSNIYRFLQITPSAETAAIGGNHVAVFDAPSSLFHLNPAFLNKNNSQTISATFVNYLADARIGFANYSYHVPSIGTLGFGIRYAGYGDLEELDASGNSLGSFNAGDLALTSALSTSLSDKLIAGVALDYIYSSYLRFKSTAITGNVGLYYLDLETQFSAGISIRNLGDQVTTYNGTREDIPFELAAGISKKPENFPFRMFLTLQKLNDWDLRVLGETERPDFGDNLFRHVILGGEANLGANFKFRLGYNRYVHEQTKLNENFDLAGASIGVGMDIKGIIIDISRNSLSDIGGVVQLSIRSKLN